MLFHLKLLFPIINWLIPILIFMRLLTFIKRFLLQLSLRKHRFHLRSRFPQQQIPLPIIFYRCSTHQYRKNMYNFSDSINISKYLITKYITYWLKIFKLDVHINSNLSLTLYWELLFGFEVVGVQCAVVMMSFVILLIIRQWILIISYFFYIFRYNLTPNLPRPNRQQRGNFNNCIRQYIRLQLLLILILNPIIIINSLISLFINTSITPNIFIIFLLVYLL